MATKKKEARKQTLIQTLVPLRVGTTMRKKAVKEGLSVAAYVRRLILIDLGPKFWHD
jgi:hypothetical protein